MKRKRNPVGKELEELFRQAKMHGIFHPVYDWWRTPATSYGGKFRHSKGTAPSEAFRKESHERSDSTSIPPVYDGWWAVPF